LLDKIPNRTEKTFQMHFRNEISFMGISALQLYYMKVYSLSNECR
jgi:hypothetical protein